MSVNPERRGVSDLNARTRWRMSATKPSSMPDDPAEALAAVVALRYMADRMEHAAVTKALAQGWSWSQIAEALGVTKQAAHKRLAGLVVPARK